MRATPQPDDAAASIRSLSNHEFFIRLGRKLTAALSEATADGYVFRVDLRLRPWGDSGPLAMGFAMLEDYLVAQGRPWERYAWIKARPLTGSRHDELTQIVRPFVFRKYLDFGAFAAIRDLHVQIRREVARREMAHNVKLGPGGIREIEFTAQVFQLIRGGQIAALQQRPTLVVLGELVKSGLMTADAQQELAAAYDFLRRLEHRIQYLDDAQTQLLPDDAESQAMLAEAMGFADYAALLAALDRHRNKVTRHFEQVFAAPQTDQQSHPLTACAAARRTPPPPRRCWKTPATTIRRGCWRRSTRCASTPRGWPNRRSCDSTRCCRPRSKSSAASPIRWPRWNASPR
jgi:[glutamine synthetase] adenylyltransferase / [glutamine synthetase]-adenylyl-L-tyrosine phosphorylase